MPYILGFLEIRVSTNPVFPHLSLVDKQISGNAFAYWHFPRFMRQLVNYT